MFDKIRDVLSKAFSSETEGPDYGHEDHAVFPPPMPTLLAQVVPYTPDEVIGEHVTVPAQFFTDRGLTPEI